MITREFDTIAAISTPLGEGAIGIVRLSGTDSFAIAQKIFKGKDLSKVASHSLNYGHIVDPLTGKVMDEVMVGAMKSPKTFTREDIIEINTHGGIAVTNEILQLAIREGARMAEPGEFTKRAFLNGRVDLTQAEAVMDIIRAKTDKAMMDPYLTSLTILVRKFSILWLRLRLISITLSMTMWKKPLLLLSAKKLWSLNNS